MLVYCSNITNRVRYILGTLLNAAGVNRFYITDKKEEYILSGDVSLNYSERRLKQDEFFIETHSIIFQKNIVEQEVEVFTSGEKYKAFFKTGGDFSFDVFAAAFYLLARYEEYLPHVKDIYGRYAHENSLAFKQDFLHLPLINIWLADLTATFKSYFPQLILQPARFQFIPTYDIDIAFFYKGKGILRNMKGMLSDAVALKPSAIVQRKNVLLHAAKDPADVYEWLTGLHSLSGLSAIYFFLFAAEQKGYDRNIPVTSVHLKKLAEKLIEVSGIGLHPSWHSGEDDEILKQEKDSLEQVTGVPAIKSRQHYIRMEVPYTYRSLISAGILEDYSMGFGSINGFRASYCLPYKWFDLEKDAVTELTVYPFCFMDANANYEQHLSPEQAFEELQEYHDLVRKFNGTLITIFHNHFLAETRQWQPWRNMYQSFLEKNFSC